MSKNTSNPHTKIIIALVVLVAVVTVVIFGFQKNEFSSAPVSEGEEGALAGEAFAVAAQQNLVFLGGQNLNQHYGNTDWQFVKTGRQICRDMGYRSCFAEQLRSQRTLYEGGDGSCRNAQLDEVSSSLTICDVSCTAPENQRCQIRPDYSEPETGDYLEFNHVTAVICGK